jgi:ferritin
MQISEAIAKKLNEQVTNEYGAFWIYQQMAYKLEAMGLSVFSQWFVAQAAEERGHAQKIADYLLDQGAEVELLQMPQPKADYKDVEEICQGALDHEQKVTKQIHELVKMADQEDDFATRSFLAWFVDEQVEEVATATQLLDLVKMAQTPGQLMMLEGRIMALRGGE